MFKINFMNTSLKMRMILLYTLFAVALVAGITFYAYYFTVDLLKKEEMVILSDSLGYLENDISMRLEAINEEYINIFNDDSFINLYMKNAYGTKEVTEQVALNNEFQNWFLDMKMRNNDLVEAIYLFSEENIFSSDYRLQYSLQQLKESPYYEECMKYKNRILYRNIEPEGECFSIARSFYYLWEDGSNSIYPGVGYISEDNDDYSVLIFFLKKAWLQDRIREEAIKRQTSVFIFDENGQVVVQEGSSDWISEENIDALKEEIERHESGTFEGELVKGRTGINIRKIDLVDWNIVYVYDMNILYRQAGQIRNVAVVVFIISVVIVFIIASFISRTVVTPIRDLAKLMDEVVDNQMRVTFAPKYNDEIAYLGRKFEAMIQKIADLMIEIKRIEKQKHVEELKALQAQINPHFLYNTLDMLYWMDKMAGNDDTANLVADLADFFRLSLNKGEDITTVGKEIEHVKKYLEIQKIRMDGKFDYEIILDKELAEYKVPKLILQPIVENSLIHGFEAISWQGKIEISVVQENDYILFYIADNGCGISKEERENLNKSKITRDDGHGYAVGNVKERIQLYAGEAYGLWFDTEITTGTKVYISFPMNF